MTISWNTGLAAERARHNLKIKKALKDGAYKRWKKLLKQKQQATSRKRQASSNKRQAASLKKLDPTINWDKFLKELTN